MNLYSQKLATYLKKGGIAVIPTDTIYGIVGSALVPQTVEKIYDLRQRNKNKPMIILIHSIKDLAMFNIKLKPKDRKILENLWPGKISIILDCPSKNLRYLHRGTKSLAFRIPEKKDLKKLLSFTGPLVAPSANIEGKPPAKTVFEAKKYFGNKIDFYVDAGKLDSQPSTLVALKNGNIIVKREGAYKLP